MSKKQLYRCAVLVSELQLSETDEYRTSVLCLINCLICRSEDVWARHSMRNELTVVGFLDVIDTIRTSTVDSELMIQINVFEQHRMNDDDLLDVDVEKPIYDLFSHLVQKVCRLNDMLCIELNSVN